MSLRFVVVLSFTLFACGKSNPDPKPVATTAPPTTAAPTTAAPPDTTEPAAPDTTESSVPATTDTAQPAAPDTTEPAVPETAQPAAPDTTEPSAPETAAAPPDAVAIGEPATAPKAGEAVPAGCFAWSSQDARAMCKSTSDSIQAGGWVKVALVPASEAFAEVTLAKWEAHTFEEDAKKEKLSAEDALRIEAELKRGHYVTLAAEPTWLKPLAPKGSASWDEAGVSVGWKRADETIKEETGTYHNYTDTFTVTCGTGPSARTTEWFVNQTYDAAPKVAVGLVPDGKALLLTWSDTWGIEGDSGGGTDANVFPIATCKDVPGE